ncbi:hypothetical protein BDZ85DRAFT_95913 [Elsinoe ampelina]|uniref:Uncharacterized protein n=1 Tax=Elsinoe ampelina TaxID=302913 RepID=A0A6A6GEA1_9PEZI|nr:hypothetical protein BDZ85DRAFT_95913 [Elsinoe ampelina]
MSSDAEYAREIVEEEGVWGFIIYRCSYKSDDEWSRFLKILNDHVRESLEADDEDYLDLMDTLDWAIQEKPELEGASKELVRRRFHEWASKHSELSSPRANFCVMVDQDCIDATLAAPAPPEYDSENKAFVYIIDKNWRQKYFDGSYEDKVDRAAEGERQAADEGFDPLDGCRMDDVGWMKLAISHVAPRAFSILDDPGWEGVYRRPPVVVKP